MISDEEVAKLLVGDEIHEWNNLGGNPIISTRTLLRSLAAERQQVMYAGNYYSEESGNISAVNRSFSAATVEREHHSLKTENYELRDALAVRIEANARLVNTCNEESERADRAEAALRQTQLQAAQMKNVLDHVLTWLDNIRSPAIKIGKPLWEADARAILDEAEEQSFS